MVVDIPILRVILTSGFYAMTAFLVTLELIVVLVPTMLGVSITTSPFFDIPHSLHVLL